MTTLRADLHIHTLASDGADDVVAILAVAEAQGLDMIAITDHERTDAARVARIIADDLGLRVRVVVGEEVTTRRGHLLVLGLEQAIRPYRSLRDTIAAAHDAGALAIPAHPLVPWPSGAGSRVLRDLAGGDPYLRPDALETLNHTPFGRKSAATATLADECGYAGIGSTDAHVAAQVGWTQTEWDGDPADAWGSFRKALTERRTRPVGGPMNLRMFADVALGKAEALVAGERARLRGLASLLHGAPRSGRSLGWPGSEERPPRLDLPEVRRRAAVLGLGGASEKRAA